MSDEEIRKYVRYQRGVRRGEPSVACDCIEKLLRERDDIARFTKQVENKTHAYFHSIWKEDMHAVPRFLWNAKMRFGKTFTTYQLAKKLGATRVLVVTFKPAVEDAWQTDLESHVDFNEWQYLSKSSGRDPTQISSKKPLVYFGSFQDLLGRDAAGNIKPKNEWVHKVKWDLVVFDEYHFGAWRDTAKELFEGEEDAVAKKDLVQRLQPRERLAGL